MLQNISKAVQSPRRKCLGAESLSYRLPLNQHSQGPDSHKSNLRGGHIQIPQCLDALLRPILLLPREWRVNICLHHFPHFDRQQQ
jgi:hypothetical protein